MVFILIILKNALPIRFSEFYYLLRKKIALEVNFLSKFQNYT